MRERKCDACGEKTRRWMPRPPYRTCKDCRRLPQDKWEAAVAELDRIEGRGRGVITFDVAPSHSINACQAAEAWLASRTCPICKGHSRPGDCSCPCQM